LDSLIKIYTESTKNTEQFKTTINTNQDVKSKMLQQEFESENAINEVEDHSINESRKGNH